MDTAFSYVIIEDEPIVRQGTRLKMESTGLPFKLVGEAGDGVSGCEIIRAKRPDLALVDMRMPSMDGVELMHAMRAEGSDVRFIIISGHSDFSYAQEGIKAGVSAYLLKPFTDAELKEALKIVMHSITSTPTNTAVDDIHIASANLRNALHGTPLESGAENCLRELGISSLAGTWLVAEIISGQKLRKPEMPPSDLVLIALARQGANQHAYCIGFSNRIPLDGDMERFSDALRTQWAGINSWSIGIGQPQTHISQLYIALDQAHHARLGMPIGGDQFIGIHGSLPPNAEIANERGLFDRMQFCLKAGDLAWFERVFDQYLLECARANAPLTQALSTCRRLLENTLPDTSDPSIGAHPSIYQFDYMIRQLRDTEHAKQSILRFFRDAFGASTDADDTASGVVHAVRRYISAHFTEDVSLDRLADLFGVSSSYLSVQFKTRLGINFNAYLNSLRVEHAKRLLAETQFNISDIAARSGFMSEKYFYRLFKQKVGVTPQHYRAQHTDEDHRPRA